MKNVRRPTYSFLILVIGLIVINTFLAWFSIFISHIASPTLLTGVAVISIAAAFMVIFTLWFGMYGAIAAYIGGFFGAGLFFGMPPTVVVYLSFADLWMVLIPLVAFRIFEVNVGIESRRDLFHLVLFGVIINNFVTATWGSLSLAMGGVIGWNQVMTAFLPWFVGNAITTIIIVPLVLHHLTNRVSRSKVFVKTYWY